MCLMGKGEQGWLIISLVKARTCFHIALVVSSHYHLKIENNSGDIIEAFRTYTAPTLRPCATIDGGFNFVVYLNYLKKGFSGYF